MATLEGVNTTLASAVQRLIAASPYRIGISSGLRTRAQQQALYNRYKAGQGALAAAPGRSNHERGNAVDLDYPDDPRQRAAAAQWVRQNAARFGLSLPVRGEDWHVEVPGAGHAGAGLDDDAASFNTGNPEDALKARLDRIWGSLQGAAPSLEGMFRQRESEQMRSTTEVIPGQAPMQGAQQGAVAINYNPKGGVDQWRPLVAQALRYVGEPATEANITMTLRRMKQESGGNPTIANNWDANAKRGTPSIGLMQVIKPTFDKYAGEFRSRGQTDPLANLVASMRYAKARYGSLAAAYTRRGGY